MINGEGTPASPDTFDPPRLKSDGTGGASTASSPPYSSCGESELERYCSANSALGTPSSVATFNDCFGESEFGSVRSVNGFVLGDDFDNFSLEGNLKISSNRRFEFQKDITEEGRRLVSVKRVGSSSSCLNMELNEEDGNSSRYEHSEGEDSMYDYGTGDDQCRNNSLYRRKDENENENKNVNENPLGINSAVAFGADDWDNFEQEASTGDLGSFMLDASFASKRVQDRDELQEDVSTFGVFPNGCSSLGEPVLVEEVKDIPVDDDLVKDAKSSLIHAVSSRRGYDGENYVKYIPVTRNELHDAEGDLRYLETCSITDVFALEQAPPVEKAPVEIGSDVVDCGRVRQHQSSDANEVIAVDERKLSERHEIGEYNAQLDFLAGCDPKEIGLDVLDSGWVRQCHSSNANEFLAEFNPLAGCAPMEKRSDVVDSDRIRLHQSSDAEDTAVDERTLSEQLENGKFKAELDSFSVCAYPVYSSHKINAVLSDYCKPDLPSYACESIVHSRFKNLPVPADVFEEHTGSVKMENLELNEYYEEVVHDMEEILLESVGSSGATFSQGNKMFQPQFSMPLRDGGSSGSTSCADDAYPRHAHVMRIDGVEVVGAKQKKGDVSFSERLVGVKEYTVYKIRVWCGDDQWEVERRYRDFCTLHRRLKSLFSEQGWILPPPWSSVERESRKIFGNASPDVVAERSILIQECLCSIIHSRFSSSLPSALIWFLSPQDSFPSTPPSNNMLSQSTYFSRGQDTGNVSPLGKTISLIVEIRLPKSMKQILEAQHYTCAGCHKHFDDGMTLMRDLVQSFGWGKPRLCEYTGQLFCSSCHTNETAVLPARVLHDWDFTLYPVSQLAKSYLDSIHDQPMLCVSAVNPFLFSKVPALHHVMGIRKKLGSILPYVRCPFRMSINKGLGSRRYLLESNDFFALKDLIDLSKGAFAALPVMVETISRKIQEHIVEQCLICCDVGVPCSARQSCNDPSSLIFPFQEGEIEKCMSCESVYHKHCFKKIESCPCGVLLRADETTRNSNTITRGVSFGANGALDLLGKTSSAALPMGFLSRLFSKTKPEEMEHKDDKNIISMGSLPSNYM